MPDNFPIQFIANLTTASGTTFAIDNPPDELLDDVIEVVTTLKGIAEDAANDAKARADKTKTDPVYTVTIPTNLEGNEILQKQAEELQSLQEQHVQGWISHQKSWQDAVDKYQQALNTLNTRKTLFDT